MVNTEFFEDNLSMVAEREIPTEEQIENDTPAERTRNPGETPPNPLSKRQLKKQKKLIEYAIKRKERRLKEREKQKQKRQAAIAQGLPAQIGPSRKELKKRQATVNEDTASVKVAIDLDYDDIMNERDVAKCVKQCLRIYTINRRSEKPGQLHFTGIKLDGRIHNSFKRNDGWENWKIGYHLNQTHTEVFERDKLVYLTCESDAVLDKLESECVYVIGGLVDHNHQKGLCHERATKAGLRTARLPLSEYVDMKSRSVLSTYHVFELLLRVAGGSSWMDAILATIPLRKGAKPKNHKSQSENVENCENTENGEIEKDVASDVIKDDSL